MSSEPTATNELAAALAKAQGMMRAASKDSTNPHFKSKFADLASVWEAIREPLSTNGLAVVQLPSTEPNGGATITTVLLHTSGQSLSAKLTMPVAQATPQGFGSALTYCRRYALCAVVGVVADEDDDANAAMPRTAAPPAPRTQAPPVPPMGQAAPPPSPPRRLVMVDEPVTEEGIAAGMDAATTQAALLEWGKRAKALDKAAQDRLRARYGLKQADLRARHAP
jgi:ERF superfamily